MHKATQADGKEILRILESSAAKGSIELIYTRRPDAFESYMREPGESHVFVSREGERAIGTCAELIRKVYIDGKICRAAYICGLKKDAAYEGGIGFGAGFVRDLACDGVDFYYCSVVSDNAHVQRTFEKSKRAIAATPITAYRTYILNPRLRYRIPAHNYIFRQATADDTEELLAFLNAEGKRSDLFPVVESLEDFYNLHIEDFYLLTDTGGILAAAALWRQTEYRQYVVKRYKGMMRLARYANPLLEASGYIRLPKENQALDFPMLSFFVCKDGDQTLWRILFGEIKREAAKRYGMMVIGLPHKHYAALVLNRLPSIRFDTELYEISFPWKGPSACHVNSHAIYPECGLL